MAATAGVFPVTFEVVLRHGDTEIIVGEVTKNVTVEFTMPPAPAQQLERSCGCPDNSLGCQRNSVTGKPGHLYGAGKAANV